MRKTYTLQGTNISPKNWHFEDDFPFPKVGYVDSWKVYRVFWHFRKFIHIVTPTSHPTQKIRMTQLLRAPVCTPAPPVHFFGYPCYCCNQPDSKFPSSQRNVSFFRCFFIFLMHETKILLLRNRRVACSPSTYPLHGCSCGISLAALGRDSKSYPHSLLEYAHFQ